MVSYLTYLGFLDAAFLALSNSRTSADTIQSMVISLIIGLVSGVISGLIVWRVTDCYMRKREKNHLFQREKQELSRVLGEIRIALCASDVEFEASTIRSLINTASPREAFITSEVDDEEVLLSLSSFLDELDQDALTDRLSERDYRKVRAGEAQKKRVAILKLRAKQ